MARRRGTGRGVQGRAWGNWVIGGTVLSSVGAPSNQVSWGTQLTPAAGSAASVVLVSAPDYTPAAATPQVQTIGMLEVDAVEGSISITNPTGAVVVGVVVAIYLAKQLSTASTSLAVVDPSVAADAMHDDYFFLRGFAISGSSATHVDTPINIPVGISRPVIVPSGHCLVCTVGVVGGTATINATPFIRSHIRRSG